jgi:hypothetical protein
MRSSDFDDLPDVARLIPANSDYSWAQDEARRRFLAEIEAARTSLALGYLHHTELHQRQAVDLLLQDLARHDTPGQR